MKKLSEIVSRKDKKEELVDDPLVHMVDHIDIINAIYEIVEEPKDWSCLALTEHAAFLVLRSSEGNQKSWFPKAVLGTDPSGTLYMKSSWISKWER